MKYFVVCCAFLIALSPVARAQGGGIGIQGDVMNFNFGNMTNTYSFKTGNDFTGDLKNIYGLGWGGGLHVDLDVVIASLRVSADYITLSPDRNKYTALLQQYIGDAASAVTVDGGRIDIYSLNANLNLNLIPLSFMNIYATGGVGLVRVSVAATTVSFNGSVLTTFPAVESQTKFAANVGAGADFPLGGVTLFAELKIDFIFTAPKTSTAIPYATVGLTF